MDVHDQRLPLIFGDLLVKMIFFVCLSLSTVPASSSSQLPASSLQEEGRLEEEKVGTVERFRHEMQHSS